MARMQQPAIRITEFSKRFTITALDYHPAVLTFFFPLSSTSLVHWDPSSLHFFLSLLHPRWSHLKTLYTPLLYLGHASPRSSGCSPQRNLLWLTLSRVAHPTPELPCLLLVHLFIIFLPNLFLLTCWLSLNNFIINSMRTDSLSHQIPGTQHRIGHVEIFDITEQIRERWR